jgi:hypothetical protein
VTGDVLKLDAQVHSSVTRESPGRSATWPDLAGLGIVLAPAFIRSARGFACGHRRRTAGRLAARWSGPAEALISHEPLNVLVAGLLGSSCRSSWSWPWP